MFIDGKDLSQIYDNRHFQKQADVYGIDDIIVSYVPHTPASLLLYAPICKFDPLTAKRIWLILNILFLLGTILLLKRIFDLSLILCSIVYLGLIIPVANNFLYGQPYIFLAFGICIVLYLWKFNKDILSGLMLGIISSIKPFPAILLIPALYNRRQKIIGGFILGFLIFQIPILILSPEIYTPYFNLVLPASIEGNIQNPYDTQFGTIAVFLRNAFYPDPFRNQSPIYNSPFLYFYFKAFLSLFFLILYISFAFKFKSRSTSYNINESSLFIIPAFLISPFLSSYQYVMLVFPLIFLVGVYKSFYYFIFMEFIFFFILKHFQIPFSELIFILIVTIYIAAKENTPILRARLSYYIAYLLILLLPCVYAYYSINRINVYSDKAEPVMDINVKGFPGELRSFGSNLYFTEISDGNYHLNLNGKDIGFKGYDIFHPCILPIDDYLLLACQMIDKGRSQIVLFAEKEHKWSVLWKEDVKSVDDLEIARWLGNPFDGVALAWIDADEYILTICWPFSQGEKIQISVHGALKTTWCSSTGDLPVLTEYKGYYSVEKLQLINKDKPVYKVEPLSLPFRVASDFYVSPNSQYYIFSVKEALGNTDIEIFNPYLHWREKYTTHLSRDLSPIYMPSTEDSEVINEYIYFISERGGGLNDGRIYRIDLTSLKQD